MSPGAIVAIIVAVVVVVAVAGALTVSRRRALRRRYGLEYDRLVAEKGSHRKAQAELAERERRVQSLDIRPLADAARATFTAEWAAIQERFVDHPPQAVTQAGLLVVAVMKERGYQTGDHDQLLADLSVAHPNSLDHYRAARAISMDAEAGRASTEDLRLGMLHYRALFTELLNGSGEDRPARGEPAAAGPGTASAALVPAPRNGHSENADR
jgi:hypothetical protein